jgi:hypothetical protein
MTEAEWLGCTPHDTNLMVHFLAKRQSPRKIRLFVCGCCRRLWPLLLDERLRNGVVAAEQDADCPVPSLIPYGVSNSVSSAYSEVYGATPRTSRLGWDGYELMARCSAAAAVLCLGGGHQPGVAHHASVAAKYQARANRLAGRPAAKRERDACLRLLRCVAGNPFRPVVFSPEWRTSTVVAIARGMYESRDFSAMPILADALQDAGCDNDDVLTHCRDQSQVHVRGCWVVDLVLDKE